jgi:hypothetical protein
MQEKEGRVQKLASWQHPAGEGARGHPQLVFCDLKVALVESQFKRCHLGHFYLSSFYFLPLLVSFSSFFFSYQHVNPARLDPTLSSLYI